MVSGAVGAAGEQPPSGARRQELDVRPILASGGEPFGAIMEKVAALEPHEVLALRTPFDPRPLHRVLGEKGFSRLTRELDSDDFVTEYWRP